MATFTTSDGVRLAFAVEGSGPGVLFHLGAGCDAGLWREAGYLEKLATRYTCLLFDHRGHGGSDIPRGPAAYELDRMTSDVIEFLDFAGLESVAFWGYSAGVSVGVRLAERSPARVWALVANGSVSPPEPVDELAEWVEADAQEYREYGWEKLIELFEEQEREPIPQWMKERMRATDVEQWVNTFETYPFRQWSAWTALPTLAVPTLFVTGELEDPSDRVGGLVAQMLMGERQRIAGKGHLNVFLASATVLRFVAPFLQKHTPPN